ncbi:hypothetical protein BLOT_007894 [Blomia tropicalis]|nr:hypothetical protein BLOT_007894 [Blomia tropicalis]
MDGEKTIISQKSEKKCMRSTIQSGRFNSSSRDCSLNGTKPYTQMVCQMTKGGRFWSVLPICVVFDNGHLLLVAYLDELNSTELN